MSQPLRLLIVEDSDDDVELILRALRRGGFEPDFKVVDDPVALRDALQHQQWDVITSDNNMPQFSAAGALAVATEVRPDVPLIIVSGDIDLNLAVEMIQAGARDYIQKRELARLVPAITAGS